MSLKPDRWIREMSEAHGLLDPFDPGDPKPGEVSSGLSSYGYDLRLGTSFIRPDPSRDRENVRKALSPKNPKPELWDELTVAPHGAVVILPGSLVLGHSLERIRMPDDVFGVCQGKSSLARCGVNVPICPVEPSWEGHLTIEIFNAAPVPVEVYAHEGIAQLCFFQGDEPPEISYERKGGKYQGQEGHPVMAQTD